MCILKKKINQGVRVHSFTPLLHIYMYIELWIKEFISIIIVEPINVLKCILYFT